MLLGISLCLFSPMPSLFFRLFRGFRSLLRQNNLHPFTFAIPYQIVLRTHTAIIPRQYFLFFREAMLCPSLNFQPLRHHPLISLISSCQLLLRFHLPQKTIKLTLRLLIFVSIDNLTDRVRIIIFVLLLLFWLTVAFHLFPTWLFF